MAQAGRYRQAPQRTKAATRGQRGLNSFLLLDPFKNKIKMTRHNIGYPMTCSIPRDLEELLIARAATRETTVDQLVAEALTWYLHVDEETLDELNAWQEIRDEAVDLVEDQPQ